MAVGEQRPGGRSAQVRAAVLAATVEVLDDVGYDQLSYEAVATRAGVHRTTVYRRWPDKADLVADAVDLRASREIPIPDTGSLRGDLVALAVSVARTLGGQGGERARATVAAAAASDEVATQLHAYWGRRMELAGEVVRRAIARGEIDAVDDATEAIEAVIAPLWLRLLVTGGPIDEPTAARSAERIAAALGAD